MKLSGSAYRLLARLGLALGLAFLAGALLTVSIAVSAETAHPLTVLEQTADPGAVAPVTEALPSVRSAQTEQPAPASLPASAFDALGSADPAEAVQRAWQRARSVGDYRFTTDLVESDYPARTLSNAGRGPQRVELHMEGDVNLSARTMEFRVWQPAMSFGPPGGVGAGGTGGGGSVMTPGSGAEARIEGDRAYVRPAGGDWKEVEDFSASFAPDNDPLAFLAGIKNVRELAAEEPRGAGVEERALAFRVSRFGFDLDGPTLATYLRDRLERQLSERGGLPLNVTLDAPAAFREMIGQGELWVDGQGLPLRLQMHMVFPEQRDGARLEADFQTDFSDFPEQLAVGPSIINAPVAWAGALFSESEIRNPQSPINKAAKTGSTGGALACGLGATALLLASRRSRRLYAAVVIAVILSMIVVPLMQSERAVAFFERQAARSQDLMSLGGNGQLVDAETAQASEAKRQAVEDFVAPSWNPAQDPLAQPDNYGRGAMNETPVRSATPLPLATATPEPSSGDQNCDQDDTADSDNDGVNNFEECVYGVVPSNADTDADGLTDGQELNKLGTNPTNPDTDGDAITDTLEVQGFAYGGRRWYLNPNNADSNNDGLIDSVECPVLVDLANPAEADFESGCDTDKDGIPNPFDLDNDNDSVPDRVDLSPDGAVDKDGKRYGQAGSATAFNGDRAFKLSVTNLQAGWPVFVDLQLRPVAANHLAYSMNVLDWPAGDVRGQIQHGKNTTFANSDNPDIANPQDTSGANGDMRLVPLLEILMTGQHIPLKLTHAAVTVTVRAQISATVKMAQGTDHAGTDFTFTFGAPGPYDVKLYDGSCPVSGNPVHTFSGIGSGAIATHPENLVDLADGQHAMVVSRGTTSQCAGIPNAVNGPYTDRMVDPSVLSPYGITVQDRPDGTVVAYVPLSVAPDDTGGGKSAFQARMLYWPGEDSTWDEPQQMRVLWVVEMLTDSCKDAKTWEAYHKASPEKTWEDYADYLDSWCQTNRSMDQIQPVQTYDESWYLTGLAVREDHGLDVAVAYPNPELSAYADDALWTLSWGLGKQFIPGRNCETHATLYDGVDSASCQPDKLRDLTIFLNDTAGRPIGNSTIRERFDITSSVPITYRWGIAKDALPLRVENFRYLHQDYLAYLSMTETPRILAQFDAAIAPSLLFAREERYRSAGLEAATMPADDALAMNLAPAVYRETTLTGLQWAPFRYNRNAGPDGKVIGWEGYPASDYWDTRTEDLLSRFRVLFGDDPETNMGRVATARSYEFALMTGVANIVLCTPEDAPCPIQREENASDEMLVGATQAMLSGLNHVAVEVVFEAMRSRQHFRAQNTFADLGRNGDVVSLGELVGKTGWKWGEVAHPEARFYLALGGELLHALTSWTALTISGPPVPILNGVVLCAAAAALFATIAISLQLGIAGGQIAAIVMRAGMMVITVVTMIYAFALVKAVGGFAAATRLIHGLAENCKKAGVIGTIVHVALVWGTFLLSWLLGRMAFSSMAWDSTLAGTIAGTLASVILFAIFTALGPIGALAAAILGLINLVMSLICNIFPQLQATKAAPWLCGGITGAITNGLVKLIYSGTIIVDLNPAAAKGPPWHPRLALYDFSGNLVDQKAGLVKDNAMSYSLSLTHTLDLAKVPIAPLELWFSGQFNETNLRRANFAYKLQREQEAFHEGLYQGGLSEIWQPREGRPVFYTTRLATTESVPLAEAGINRPVSLYLSEAYAVPEQECWGLVFEGVCAIATEKGTAHLDLSSVISFDVLPSTLDGFYQLARKEHGWALAWGQQDKSLTFPALYDADGDGLARTEDPNDSKWDTDGDGLSDYYEHATGSSPTLPDTDGDGLSDQQETLFGADPSRKDSDGDGLYDCQEVFHQVVTEDLLGNTPGAVCGTAGEWSGGWSIVYGTFNAVPRTTLVTSNPTEVDTDYDGLTDAQEMTYGYNPRLYSEPNVLSLNSELSEVSGEETSASDGFLAPDQMLYYSATVKNELDNRQAQGLFSTATSPILDNAGLLPRAFVLGPQAQASVSGTLDVLPDAASGTYSLTQVAGALITDLSVESRGASLWLRFDEPVGSTVFADSSGRVPAHDGACGAAGACSLDAPGGRFGGGLKLAGTGYVEVPLDASETSYALSLWFKTTCTNCGIFSADSGSLGSGGHDRDVYLSNGNVCAHVSSDETKCTAGRNWADGQWHQVIHTFGGSAGGQKIYIDGVLGIGGAKNASTFTAQDGINIGFSSDAAQDYFSGSIDDVRIFDRGLTPGEVADLATQPVFRMDFDATNAWSDVSSFRTPIPDCGSHCPTHSTTAVAGRAAAFDGSQYLSVPSAGQLDLSGGQFTMAAWILPETRSGALAPEGILGLRSGTATAYPSLVRAGRKIQFGFGTGSQWQDIYQSGDILVENQWNHVALVYNTQDAEGTARLYLNGVLVGAKPLLAPPRPAATRNLDIGRSSDWGTIYIERFYEQLSLDGFSACWPSTTAEMCMAINGTPVLNSSFDCYTGLTMNKYWNVTGPTKLVLWEDDTDPRCGTEPTAAPNGGDDVCTIRDLGTALNFTTSEFSKGDLKQYDFYNCAVGYFKLSYTNPYTPFYGKIDDVVIYNQALGEDAVKELLINTVTALHLPFDEAPGTSTFRDTSLGRAQAACSPAGCPTAGVDGRLNRAVWFEAARSQSLNLAHGPANESATSFTAAAWVKPSKLGGIQRIASAARTKSANGWAFGLDGAELSFTSYGEQGDHTYKTTNLGLQNDRWYHVAVVVDISETVWLFVDGVLKAKLGATGPTTVDTDDLFMIGATTAPGSVEPIQRFDGQIDDLWVFKMPLTAGKIAELVDSAPILHLRFDEAHDKTRFADAVAYNRYGACTETRCPVTGEAVRGQVGLAAEFDGVNDMVVVADSEALRPASFSIGAWVMPITASQNLKENPRHQLVGKWKIVPPKASPTNFNLYMYDNLKPGLSWGCAETFVEHNSEVPLILNHWNHLMGTFDGKTLRIYVNGVEAASPMAPPGISPCTSDAAIEIGGDTDLGQQEYFRGRLDEVVLYKRALSASEVRELYRYQGGWFEDRQSRDITVDSDSPTAEVLMTEGAYLANRTIWVGVTADDPTSGVAGVELGVQKDSGSYAWARASRCAEGAGEREGAWCPEFAPAGQGVYTLRARATDSVGYTGLSEPITVIVDDTPPLLTLDQGADQRLDAIASQTEPNMWTIHLSGTAEDSTIAAGVGGSGVPSDGVHVTLRDADGNALGAPAQTATLAGSAWSVDYAIVEAKPTGCYEVQVTAEDNVARIPNLDADQVARHSAAISRTIRVDADAPGVQLNWANVAGGQIGPKTTTLDGAVSARPVQVAVSWTTGSAGSAASLAISCRHGSSGALYTAYTAPAGTFEPNREYSWSEESQIHQGSACMVTLAATGDTGVASGQVKVCGVQVASWVTERIVSFAATSDACEPKGCGSGVKVAGVRDVDIAYTSVLPGSAFVNEAPPNGELLHMAFEDTPDRNGLLFFRDASGAGNGGSCTGTACPTTGQAGPSGSAAGFDGYDDAVAADSPISLAGASFSAAFWARRDGTGQDHVVIGQGAAIDSRGLTIGFRAGNQFTCGFWGDDLDTLPYTDTGWHHWACTYNSATMQRTIYRDGVQVAQAPASANYQGSGSLVVGAFPGGSSFFNGLVDEVRILNRTLSAADVQSLYTGSGPLLVLPFEQAWASAGAYLPDDSGWGNDGALQAGAGDLENKAVVGEVGDYALGFDGVNDSVSIENFGVFTTTTVSAWVYHAGTTAAREAIVSYKEAGDCGFTLALEELAPKFYVRAGPGWTAAVEDANQVPPNQWVHLAGTYDGSTLRLYRNGKEVGTASGIGGMVQCSGSTAIGSRNSNDMHWFAGAIDDVRIYGRALGSAEISDLYRGGWQAATLSASGVEVESTDWSATVPTGLEGTYRIDMRGTDVAGHSAAVRERTPLWSGEADTLAPRVTLHRTTVDSKNYRYTTVAEDYHLAETSFSTPCGTKLITSREYFQSPWYVAVVGEDQKLYRLTAECETAIGRVTEQATACDGFGNCATVGVTSAAEVPQLAEGFATGAPEVPDLSGKQGQPKFDVTLDSTVLTTTHYYEPRTVNVTGLVRSQNSPDAGGHALAGLHVSVGGVSGPAILSEPAALAPYTVTWRFPWRLAAGALPDGVGYTAVLTATDRAGRTTTTSSGLVADVVPPAPVTLTLSGDGVPLSPGDIVRNASSELALSWTASSDGSGLAAYTVSWTAQSAKTTTVTSHSLEPGQLLEDRITAGEAQQIAVALASRDYYGNERWQSFGRVIADSKFTPDYLVPLSSTTLGAGAGGEGWLDSGCALLSADRRIADSEGSRWSPQQLYATWDHSGLRLTWTGANWSDDGDLFVYLDTGEGGTINTFAPYPLPVTATVGFLPPDMQADAVVWVQSSNVATLLRWDGGAWGVQDDEGSPRLSVRHFRFEGQLYGGRTDLFLPFELLGISAGAPLSLIAYAAEEPDTGVGLRVWATLPQPNPVNSDRVNVRTALAPDMSSLAFTHAYRWTSVTDGICPNGSGGRLLNGHHNDATLELRIDSDPPGASARGLEDGRFWVSNPGLLGAGLGSRLGVNVTAHPPLPDGQAITYKVPYRNKGSQTLWDGRLSLTASGALRLGVNQIDLGDIEPGVQGTVVFTGTVDRSLSSVGIAALVVQLYDAAHGPEVEPLEWLTVLHQVDRGAPKAMGLDAPVSTVGPETGWLTGYAYDESGVSSVEIQVHKQGATGAPFTRACDLKAPASGRWSCPWDGLAANGGIRPADGDEFTVRLKATDQHGYTSDDWSDSYGVRVDAQPPTVTHSLMSPGAAQASLVRGSTLRLTGEARDEAGVQGVAVCLEDETCREADLGVPGSDVVWWSHWLMAAAAGGDAAVLDYVTKTVSIGATDRLGNGTEDPERFEVVFDNTAPVLEVVQLLAQVPLRSAGAALMSAASASLHGLVSDGGPDVTVSVRVQAPDGEIRRDSAARDGDAWWYDLPAAVPGQHTLWVDAEDLAGNVTTAGPFSVDVACTGAAPVATGLTAEPVAGWPISLTLTAVISNTGRDPLPAGMPVTFYEGDTTISVTSTEGRLAPGESQTLSVVWVPDAGRDYDIGVTVGQNGIPGPAGPTVGAGADGTQTGVRDLPHIPLCATPPTAHFNVPVRDLPLYLSWNLISPPVDPDNKDVQVVQRAVEGAYTSIQGYESGLLAYYPDRPQDSTLKTVDALHGYWIKTLAPPDVPPEDLSGDEQVAHWRMVGELLPEDQPLTLAGGWNLVGYPLRYPLSVTTALQSIEGRYGAVLGFERTAISHYPDLDASYNTLYRMAPGYGYWIKAGSALTLSYPVTSVTQTLLFTSSLAMQKRQIQVRLAEWGAGVQPTYEWMNLYGKLALPDGTGVPTGTLVLAIDPQGVICGATATWEVGQYGLLACYADDPDTPEDEGGVPGDTIRLVVGEGTPPTPGSWVIGEGTWTAHGARQQVPAGLPPQLPHRTYLPLLLRVQSMPDEGREFVPEPATGP
jgi:hypothetical protein